MLCTHSPKGALPPGLDGAVQAVIVPLAVSSCRLPGFFTIESLLVQLALYSSTLLIMQLTLLSTLWLSSCLTALVAQGLVWELQMVAALLCFTARTPESSTQKPRLPPAGVVARQADWELQRVLLVPSRSTRLPLGVTRTLRVGEAEGRCQRGTSRYHIPPAGLILYGTSM